MVREWEIVLIHHEPMGAHCKTAAMRNAVQNVSGRVDRLKATAVLDGVDCGVGGLVNGLGSGGCGSGVSGLGGGVGGIGWVGGLVVDIGGIGVGVSGLSGCVGGLGLFDAITDPTVELIKKELAEAITIRRAVRQDSGAAFGSIASEVVDIGGSHAVAAASHDDEHIDVWFTIALSFPSSSLNFRGRLMTCKRVGRRESDDVQRDTEADEGPVVAT
ncbi:glycine, alanine and asparagine-rich protein-like [Capsicum annuum]|uniref:glycine, alanine and asparagine-rich protein-like n=1 Tax=Capsicum annuum TaxID=4072 RepID=UPI001FB0D9A7|nr:glycine, alanine and asparagine-rich protein-like [Capsicum annuum]